MNFKRQGVLLAMLVLVMAWAGLPVMADDAPAYLDATLSPDERADDLLARMTLEEKIGQMTLIEKFSLSPHDVTKYLLGGVLSGGGAYPNPNTPEDWAVMVDGFQAEALNTRLAIPIIYGVDAVHGHNNMYGAVIFPHNIGLGATRNPELVQETARITAQEMIATGIYWNYAPVLAVPQDIRWGRTYEGFGENTELVTELSLAYLLGLQGDGIGTAGSVLGTPKHFVGDGGTTWGSSRMGDNYMDQGQTLIDEETLRRVHLAPYYDALEAGAQSIMVSFSSWDGIHMHAHEYLVTDVLKGEMGFSGFVVSDWAGVDHISEDYDEAVIAAINAGVDMNMVPYDAAKFINSLTRAVENGDVSLDRIDDAVHRILRVKFAMGLFEQPFSQPELLAAVGSDAHRAVAREAVSQSLVLLKNDNGALPIASDAAHIFVSGAASNDIGIQSGGWTIEWQGKTGNITPGTTIWDGLKAAVSDDTTLHFSSLGRFNSAKDENGDPIIADVGIVVVGEKPYAEYEGDDPVLALSDADLKTIERVRERSEHLVIVLLSGRPLVITDALLSADAVVAAWLPGTEGDGVTDVLFGEKPFTGRLPFTWLRSVDQLPFDFDNLPTSGCDAPLFPYAYGLTYDDAASEWLELAATCATE